MKAKIDIYAHRAGRGLAPENTLFACEKALALGVDFIDLDLGMTRDGELVATHDISLNPDLTRDSRGEYVTHLTPVYSYTYQELAAFNVGRINPTSKYASFFPEQESLTEERIPLLKHAVHKILSYQERSIGFQFEIKTDPKKPRLTASPEDFSQALYRILSDYGIIERTEVQSFDYRSLHALQKWHPDIKTSYLTPPTPDLNPSFAETIKTMGGSCWGPFQMDIDERHVLAAHAAGVKIVPWGYPEKEGREFNEAHILKLLSWGVDGVITDRPDRLKHLLETTQTRL